MNRLRLIRKIENVVIVFSWEGKTGERKERAGENRFSFLKSSKKTIFNVRRRVNDATKSREIEGDSVSRFKDE